MSQPNPAPPPPTDPTAVPEARIDWRQPAAGLEAFVRALDQARQAGGRYQHVAPRPSATARIGRTSIGIARARAGGTMSSYPPGTITRCDDEVWVQAGRGHLAVDRVVVDGEERDAAAYLVAAGFTPGDAFDTSHRWTAPSSHGPAREFNRAA